MNYSEADDKLDVDMTDGLKGKMQVCRMMRK